MRTLYYRNCKHCGINFSSQDPRPRKKFCSNKCFRDSRKGIPLKEETKLKMRINHANVSGKNNPNYGKKMSKEVIDKIRNTKFGKETNTRSFCRYRQFMEEKIGRKLIKGEIVHHIDGNCMNNNIENLVVVSRSEHARLHKFQINFKKNKDFKNQCRKLDDYYWKGGEN